MVEAKDIVRLGETFWCKALGVTLPWAVDTPSSPARIDQFPFTSINSDSVPSVSRFERRYRLSRFQRRVAITFTSTSNHYRFQARLHRYGCKKTSIALTHGQPSLQCGLRGRWLDIVAKESLCIVGNVVMQPGKNHSSFVCE